MTNLRLTMTSAFAMIAENRRSGKVVTRWTALGPPPKLAPSAKDEPRQSTKGE